MFPVNMPLIDGNELKYISEAVETGWISSEGPFVKRFEAGIATTTGRTHSVAVTNGTAALQLAFDALQLKRGSQVIIPTFTIISCASCLVQLGLKPVPVDCDPLTFNMKAADVKAAITSETSAILVAHIYGLPVDMDEILELARQHDLKVVEDAAEAIGQTYKGKPCGSFGDISIFSFYPNKHITTGEGGMVLTDDDALFERSQWMRNLAFDKERRFIHEEIGYNFRMTNLQAAIGCGQLENLGRNIDLKRQIGRAYNQQFADLPGVQLPLQKTSYAENIYWVYTLVLSEDVEADVTDVMSALAKEGVGTRHFFTPMHRQPALQQLYPEYEKLDFPTSQRIAQKGFYIPSGLGLSISDIPEISEKIRHVLKQF